MEEILGLLPTLPIWLSIPIVLGGLLVVLAPKVLDLLRHLSAWNRSYEREKKLLELLKLRYEIETLKKEKELPDIPDGSHRVVPAGHK